MPPEPARRSRRLPVPVQVVAGLLLAASAVLLLWASSFPGDNFVMALSAVGLFAVLGLGWLVLLVVCIVRRWFSGWLVLAPVAVLAVGALAATELPDRAGFALAKPDLQAGVAGDCPSRVGWYPVSRCTDVAGSRAIIIDGAGFLSSEGFARFESAPPTPPTPGEDAGVLATPLGEDWYRVTFAF